MATATIASNGNSSGSEPALCCPRCGCRFQRVLAKQVARAVALRRLRLTPREAEAVSYLVDGMTNKEIAAKMGTTAQVIKNYMFVAYGKLGVGSRAACMWKVLAMMGKGDA